MVARIACLAWKAGVLIRTRSVRPGNPRAHGRVQASDSDKEVLSVRNVADADVDRTVSVVVKEEP